MTRGDRTGPEGMGPTTGRGAGYCAGHDMPGYAHPVPKGGFGHGWGHGRARGFGRRRRRRFWHHAMGHPMGHPGWAGFGRGPAWNMPAMMCGPCTLSPKEELEALKQQGEWMKNKLEAISQRIEEIDGEE